MKKENKLKITPEFIRYLYDTSDDFRKMVDNEAFVERSNTMDGAIIEILSRNKDLAYNSLQLWNEIKKSGIYNTPNGGSTPEASCGSRAGLMAKRGIIGRKKIKTNKSISYYYFHI